MTPRIKIGERYGPYHGRIDPDAVLAYANATNDPNLYTQEGGTMPPLQTICLLLPSYLHANSDSVEPGAIEGVRGGVHGEHDLYLHRPLAPGAELTWEVTPHCAHMTPAGVLVSQRIILSDAEGVVAEHFWSTLSLGGTIPEPLGPPLADHAFPEDARQRHVGGHVFEIARDQAFRYGGASGDRSPMHLDDEAARQAGFPSKFMQGLCTFAMCGAGVVKVSAGGDARRIRRLACRFSAPVFPGNDLQLEVYDIARGEDGTHSYVFEATSAGVFVIKHGRADIAD